MSILNNFSLKARLYFLTAVMGTLLLVVGLLGYYSMLSSEKDLESLYEERLVVLGELVEMKDHMLLARTQVLLSLQHDPTTVFAAMHDHPLSRHIDAAQKDLAAMEEEWRHASTLITDPDERLLLPVFNESYQKFASEGIRPAIDLLNAGKYRDANAVLLSKINPNYTPAAEALDKLEEHQMLGAKELHDASVATHARLETLFIAILVGGVAFGLWLAWAMASGIHRGTTAIESAASRVAKGDLRATVDYEGKCELARIAKDVNAITANFKTTLEQIAAATAQLASAAEETSAITRDSSASIKRQQSETDQVATAMNEMNATVHEVAKSASQAAGAAHGAEKETTNGKRVVGQTIEVIDGLAHDVEQAADVIRRLAKESENIGSVLDVIRGIAEQTNLLALNAAIEAARAGEQGRGFAVVADEVRTLASRTQQSTQEIQGMIERLQGGTADAVKAMEKSRTQAQAGVGQAAATGSSLDAIMGAVKTINDMNTQIASASEEQSAVAEEINKNITNIRDVALHTAEGSAQTAAASEQLAKLAEELQSLVGRFKV
jgi:methyl-accepting chemotaxis protein